MGRFHIVFDYFREKVYVRKNRNYHGKFEYNMSGIDLIADGPSLQIIRINSVVENSHAARAGLQKGDVLKVINHQRIEDLGLQDASNILRLKNRKSITMVVERDGEKLKKKFRLERIL